MTRYLVFLRSTPVKQEKPTPEQMKAMHAAFNAWQEKYKDHLVDMGGRLKPGGRVLTSEGVTDGPFAETKEVVGGYMVVAAESYDHAVEISRGCPGVVRPGSIVEIREIANG